MQSIPTLHGVAIPFASSTETKPGIEIERSVTQEPPYKVILHNDDYTPMEHVVAVLQKVIPRMSVKRAVDIMMEAHTRAKPSQPSATRAGRALPGRAQQRRPHLHHRTRLNFRLAPIWLMVRWRDSSGRVRPAAGFMRAVSHSTLWIAGMGSSERMASFTGTSRSVRRQGWILPSAVA